MTASRVFAPGVRDVFDRAFEQRIRGGSYWLGRHGDWGRRGRITSTAATVVVVRIEHQIR